MSKISICLSYKTQSANHIEGTSPSRTSLTIANLASKPRKTTSSPTRV